MTTHVLGELLHAPITRRLLVESSKDGQERTAFITNYRHYSNLPDNRLLKAVVFSHDVMHVNFHIGNHVIDSRPFWKAGDRFVPRGISIPIWELQYHAIGVTVTSFEPDLRMKVHTTLMNKDSDTARELSSAMCEHLLSHVLGQCPP